MTLQTVTGTIDPTESASEETVEKLERLGPQFRISVSDEINPPDLTNLYVVSVRYGTTVSLPAAEISVTLVPGQLNPDDPLAEALPKSEALLNRGSTNSSA